MKINFILLAVIILLSCKKKEEINEIDVVPPHNFLNQNLSGKIDGKPWEFKSGTRKFLTPLYLHVWNDSSVTDTCWNQNISNRRINIPLPNSELKTYGIGPNKYRMQIMIDDKDVDIFDATGAIEITKIEKGFIEGRIDARYDDNNYVNGNFKLKICD